MTSKFDPWGPISSTLYSMGDSDLVEHVVGSTGVTISWPGLDGASGYSHRTRIRAYKPVINGAYSALEDQQKGIFAQIIAKELLSRTDVGQTKILIGRLNDIGWTIDDTGKLVTQDALLSEQFFPAGTQYDAYVAIREIIERATNKIVIVDPYLGNNLLATIRAIGPSSLSIQLLTMAKNLKSDFSLEASAFRQQFGTVALEVRTASDFHDRFIIIDETACYHVGASIKDAGKRAFLISRLQDAPIIKSLKQYIDNAWRSATLVP